MSKLFIKTSKNRPNFFCLINYLLESMKIKPKLVDYSLFKKPKPNKPQIVIRPKKTVQIPSSNNLSFYFNMIGLLILIIGSLCLYKRLVDREKEEFEKQNVILGFHQYVQEKLDSSKDK